MTEEFGRAPHNWWRRRAPGRSAQCYRRKMDALNALREANWRTIEAWGGMDRQESPVEFEAVNHKYGKTAKSLAEAMWAALPTTKPPYCLEDIDLEALNDTDPGRIGRGFQLPDWYHEARAAAEQEAYYREQYGLEGRSMPELNMRRWKERLEQATRFMDLSDRLDLDTVRSRVHQDTRDLKVAQIRALAKHYGAGKVPTNRQGAVRALVDAYGDRKASGNLGRARVRKQGIHRGTYSTKGWAKSAPRTAAQRRRVAQRCGAGAFLDGRKFPIVSKGSTTCAPDCRGLWAAKQRAAQTRRPALVQKATRIAKRAGCAWAQEE